MNRYSSENRYFKYFNQEGKELRIKNSKKLNLEKHIIVKFKKFTSDTWKFHSPNKIFTSKEEIISFIVKNAEYSKFFKITN